MKEKNISSPQHYDLFGKEPNGYNFAHVDSYILKLEDAYTALKERAVQLRGALDKANQEIANLSDQNEKLQQQTNLLRRERSEMEEKDKLFLLDTDKNNSFLNQSKNAEAIVKMMLDARTTAEKIENDAQIKAEKIIMNAEQKIVEFDIIANYYKSRIEKLHQSIVDEVAGPKLDKLVGGLDDE